jgi:hypothetical protein
MKDEKETLNSILPSIFCPELGSKTAGKGAGSLLNRAHEPTGT